MRLLLPPSSRAAYGALVGTDRTVARGGLVGGGRSPSDRGGPGDSVPGSGPPRSTGGGEGRTPYPEEGHGHEAVGLGGPGTVKRGQNRVPEGGGSSSGTGRIVPPHPSRSLEEIPLQAGKDTWARVAGRRRRPRGEKREKAPLSVGGGVESPPPSRRGGTTGRGRASVLEWRPWCFRCLKPGHVARGCGSVADQSGLCHRCGAHGHRAAKCPSPVERCPLCVALGRRAGHKLGAPPCFRGGAATWRKREGPSVLGGPTYGGEGHHGLRPEQKGGMG